MPGDSFSASDLFSKIGKGNTVTGIVDQVLNGSLLRVIMLPEFYSVLVSVAGVQAPSMNRRGSEENREEAYGPPAKHFTECRVLNRDVKLVLQGLDRYDNLFARVLFPYESLEIDLGKELLKAGFAKTVEWSLAMMTSGVQELHALEKAAKEEKKNIWTNYVPTPSNSDKLTERFRGTIVEVTSGDCVTVLDTQANVERRVQLSSVRAPRMGTRDRKAEDWAIDAKDFLRKLIIGKAVDVQMEYNRKIPQKASGSGGDLVLMFGNVTFKNNRSEDVNVAEAVVESGFATVVKHRTDEERSCIYERLGAAEDKAKAAKLNLHSGKDAPIHRLNDISSNPKKARDYCSFLERNGKMRGIVEFVMSGHRLKIMIPKERVLIAFALAGVKAPLRAQPARGDQKELKGEPYGEDAMRFTRHHLLQREVVIQVETCDKGGTYLGTLLLPGPHPFDLGLALLERGLASLHFTFDESRPGGKALVNAETLAREAKRGIWENYKPPAEETEEENGAGGKGRRDAAPIRVAVTHIVDGSNFYIQKLGETKAPMISEQLAAMSLSDQPPAGMPLPKGSSCFAKFTVDDQWYRGYVTASSPKGCEVYFIDFGNSETLPPSRILPMDPSLLSIPPQAHACRLAYLKVPGLSEDIGYSAASLVDSLVGEGRQSDAIIVGRERQQSAWGSSKDPRAANPTLNVILTPVGETLSVNAALLEAGFAKLPNLDNVRGGALKDGIRSLQQHQEVARKQHKGLFVYGDPGDSDEEDLPPIAAKR